MDRVLLVDDEKEFTDVLSERMSSRGVEVDVAATGMEAIERIQKKSYDAIILDLVMPGMDGIETCRRLLEQNPDLQVILLSGHATVEKGVEATRLGALDFLEKPADLQKLMERIESAKARKMLLVQKRSEEKIRDILKSKGW